MHVIESPLKAWPGSIELPDPDEFTGLHWQTWRKAVNSRSESERKKEDKQPLTLNQLFCYSGLAFVAKHGDWNLEIPLDEVRGWEDDQEAELVKLVSWLGREMLSYMNSITDPKE